MSSAAPGLFAGVDAGAMARVSEVVGTRMAAASAFALVEFARDPTVAPQAMTAGIVHAHLLGAASALEAARAHGLLSIADVAAIARDAVRVIEAALGMMPEAERA